jgi:hypothetical protein
MKRALFIFGIVYALFFAIPFPMILYYNIKADTVTNLEETDPTFAFCLAVLAGILWMVLLTGYYRKWVLQIFTRKRNLLRIQETGVSREASILSVTNIAASVYELSLSFKNLVNTEIVHKMTVNVSRFEAGKRVGIIIDKTLKEEPYLILSGTEATVKPTVVALANLLWFTLLGLITVYFMYSYEWESEGMGWRFMSFGHPLIVCPLVLLFYRGLITLIHKNVSGQSGNTALIKFGGIETQARVMKVTQTGRYFNEQPEMDFELEYTDHRSVTHRQSLKKVIGLLTLDMTKQEMISIFYLKEDPAKIVFTGDLREDR